MKLRENCEGTIRICLGGEISAHVFLDTCRISGATCFSWLPELCIIQEHCRADVDVEPTQVVSGSSNNQHVGTIREKHKQTRIRLATTMIVVVGQMIEESISCFTHFALKWF